MFVSVLEWSKFSNDEARVILIGDAYTSLPKLYCDSERQNARARAFIMMDFGQSVSEQMAVIGRVHACGQQKYASLTTTFFMITNTLADFKRMICLTHQLEAQGACVEVIALHLNSFFVYTCKYLMLYMFAA